MSNANSSVMNRREVRILDDNFWFTGLLQSVAFADGSKPGSIIYEPCTPAILAFALEYGVNPLMERFIVFFTQENQRERG